MRHCLRILVFLFICLTVALADDKSNSADRGDIDNTAATDVYIEARGFVEKSWSQKSFVLKMSQKGQYETTIPPGVYDVFVSEGSSTPRCRRVLIRPGFDSYWTLKLEIDDVYTNTQKSVSAKP